MKNAFVCCTPFHVIVSIQLASKQFKNANNDIYISNHFANANEIYINVSKLGIFKNVFFVKDKEVSYDSSVFKFKKAIKLLKRDFKTIGLKKLENDYNELFIFTYSYFSLLIVDAVKSKNQKCLINMVEEGLMTYRLNNNKKEILKFCLSLLLRPFNKVLLNYKLFNNIYLFEPSIYGGNLNVNLKYIEKITPDKDNLKLYNQAFNYKSQERIRRSKFIYFDQSFTLDKSNIDEKSFLKSITKIFSEEDLIIKLHPRDDKNKYTFLNQFQINNSPYPWELIYMNECPDDMTLIAINSSALFTPKLLFDSDHKLLLLNRIHELDDNTFNSFLKKFRTINKNNVITPKTMEELEELLQ